MHACCVRCVDIVVVSELEAMRTTIWYGPVHAWACGGGAAALGARCVGRPGLKKKGGREHVVLQA
jgi:hypothetical protein